MEEIASDGNMPRFVVRVCCTLSVQKRAPGIVAFLEFMMTVYAKKDVPHITLTALTKTVPLTSCYIICK